MSLAEDRSATSTSQESADSGEDGAAIDRYYHEHAAKETESNQSLLHEALGVTSRGTCIRHPNCPVLIQSPVVESEFQNSSSNMPQLHVMSCRICFSEEKSVGIRQRKSFAAVVQHLQNMSLLPIAEESVDHLPESRRSMGTNSSNDHSTDSSAGSGSEPHKVLESILKRLAQVQNWILRQKEKEVVGLQMHVHRLEQRLVESERLSQEQKQTVKALRRTIQQDLKIIKTMATQKKLEMENASQAGSRSAGGAPSPYQPPRWQQTQPIDMMDEDVSEVTMPTVLANWTPPTMATTSLPPNSKDATPQTSNSQIQGKDESGSGRRRKKKPSSGNSAAGSPNKPAPSNSRPRSSGTKTSDVPALQQYRPPKRVPTPKVNEHKSGPGTNIAGSNHSNSSGSSTTHASSRPKNPAEIHHPGRQGGNPTQPFVWSAGQSVGVHSSTGASAGTSVETPAVLSTTGASVGSSRTQGTLRTAPLAHEDASVVNSVTNIEWNPNQEAGAPTSGGTRDIYVAPPEVRSGPGYWNDRDVSLASDPNRLFASFRGGLLDIPKCPPQPPQYAEMAGGIRKDKIVLDPNERKALRMPVRALSRDNSQASGDLVEVRKTPNQKKNLLRPIPMAPFLVQPKIQGSEVQGDQDADDKEIPLQHMAETLSAVPVSRKIDDKRPELLFGNGDKIQGGYDDSANIAEAAAVALSEDDPPSPDPGRYSMRPKRVYTVPVGMQTRRISTTSASIEDEDDNNTGRMDRTVLTATYSIETMETRETSVEGSSSADQKTSDSGSSFADHTTPSGPGMPTTSLAMGTGHAGTGHTFTSQTVRTMTNSSGGNSTSEGDEETVDTFANEDNTSEGTSLATGTDKFLFNVTGASCEDKYGDVGTYSGTILVTQGLPHGEGIMKYETGRVYEGEWVSGQWHGRGSLLNANGDSYQGEFHLDARHGKGIYTWDNGDVYTGEFRGDKRHGQGTFSFHNGNVYEGEFVDGMFEGRGRYEFNGGYYEGEWKEGRYNGSGELMYSNGAKYTGEFRNSVAHGYGTEITPDGEKRRGVWDNGQPTEYHE